MTTGLFASQAHSEARLRYGRDIRPILANACFRCHGFDPAARQAELRLDQRDAATMPRDGVQAIAPGRADQSEAVRRMHSSDGSERMPPMDSPVQLTDAEREVLRRWINEGAEYESHWSFLAVERIDPPNVRRTDWVRTEVDRFVLARLEAEGLAPAPEADRRTLIRRATLDLTGLPPTPAEIDAFLLDSSADAYERLVDRLLSSPRYGERMAVDWLDGARYADTHGYQNDQVRYMWPWREWVIRAFNANQPYDQFVVEQVAGDLLPESSLEQRLATAFNRNHRISEEGGVIDEEMRVEYVVDRTNTTATVFLGLTVACAQCHDHKYDPISQRDYYRLFAYFNQLDERGTGIGKGSDPPTLRPASPDELQLVADVTASLAAAESRVTQAEESRNADELKLAKRAWEEVKNQLEALDSSIPSVMVMQDMPTPRATHVLIRGQYDQPGEAVTPGILDTVGPTSAALPPNRLGLAQWLVDERNPLTARVAVNRFWKQRFGAGLVETTEDFGVQGEPPSHPALLDWLARRFIESGWNVKELQRLLVNSAAYRQSSHSSPEMIERDPANRLMARGPRFRLSAEQVRDGALSIGGLLCEHLGGPSVKPYQPAGLWEELTFKTGSAANYVQDSGDSLYRRSLYTFWKRTIPPPALVAFDAPSRETCTVNRPRTNTPLQALFLLNSPAHVEASRGLAQRVLLAEEADSPAQRIALAFEFATAREPDSNELAILLLGLHKRLEFYAANPSDAQELLASGESPLPGQLDPIELAAFTATASVILNLDETVSRE